jgi:hypothetical protein
MEKDNDNRSDTHPFRVTRDFPGAFARRRSFVVGCYATLSDANAVAALPLSAPFFRAAVDEAVTLSSGAAGWARRAVFANHHTCDDSRFGTGCVACCDTQVVR